MTLYAPGWVIGSTDLTAYPFAVIKDSFDPGQPGGIDPLTPTRTISVSVLVPDGTSADRNAAESALSIELGKTFNELVFTPGDGIGADTHYQLAPPSDAPAGTGSGSMTYVPDDDWEQQGLRQYDVTWTAYPFALSADSVSDVGTPATMTTIAGSWTGTSSASSPSGGTVSLNGSDLQLGQTFTTTATTRDMEPSLAYNLGGANLTGAPCLVVDVTQPLGGQFNGFAFTVTDHTTGLPIAFDLVADGWVLPSSTSVLRYILRLTGAVTSVGVVTMTASLTDTSNFTWVTGGSHSVNTVFLLAGIGRAASQYIQPPNSTGMLYSLDVAGSAPCVAEQINVHLASDSSTGLGSAIVFTCPELLAQKGFTPSMAGFNPPGTGLLTSWGFQVPAWLLTADTYLAVLNAAGSGTPTVTLSCYIKFASTQWTGIPTTTISKHGAVGGLVPLGLIPKPLRTGSSVANPYINFAVNSTGSITIKDLYLFPADGLSSLTFGTFGANPQPGKRDLWLNGPSITNGGVSELLVGDNGDPEATIDGSSQVNGDVNVPRLSPGTNLIYVYTAAATSPSTQPSVQVLHRPAWHTFAASLP